MLVKLLLVARRFPPDVRSGTETVFESLWRLARERHEVRLVAGYVRDRSLIPADALGVDLRGRSAGLAHAAMWRAAAQAARSFRPDAVLANSIEVPVTRWPTACIVHDLNFGGTARSWWREAVYRWRGRRLDRIVTPSRATRDALLRLGLPEDRVVVVHNGVDIHRFSPAPRPADEVAQIAYPGRILPGKGQHLAIDAVARLSPAEKKRVHLSITGTVVDPVYFDQLRVQAYRQPVSFHVEVEDIAPYYQRADLVVFPTLLREGFGYTAVEAMACGVPVIWSEQPAIREATGGIGFPVPPDDPVAIRDAIRAFLADPAPFRRAGAEGRRFAEERYAWDVVWGHYERVLEQIAAR